MARRAEIDPGPVAAALAQAAKYRTVHADTLAHVAAWAAARGKTEKEAVKLAKRKLHQIFAAFLPGQVRSEVRRLSQLALAAGDAAGRETACRAILRLHASTDERLPILPAFGALLRGLLPAGEATVLDVACGLNPFALPLLGAPPDLRWIGMDIDCELMGEVDRFLKAFHPRSRGECRDVLAAPPAQGADVALLLKSVTTLEQEEKGAAARLIAALAAPVVVVSFPTRSLGGRDRGMEETYRGVAERLLAGAGTVEEALLGTELFFILRRAAPAR